MKELKTLGVIGGIGPMATVCFMDMVVSRTHAERDQDHIPMLIFNDTRIPDRTDHILDKTKPNPLPRMIEDARKLEANGADIIVIPCNTAHYFYEEIAKSVSVPVLNIIEVTVNRARAARPGLKKLGILATRGTIEGGGYKKYCDEVGIEYCVPDERDQQVIMDIIYNQVKAGKSADIIALSGVIADMEHEGCDAVILGCTELSVVNKQYNITGTRPDVIDSMEALAEETVAACGG